MTICSSESEYGCQKSSWAQQDQFIGTYVSHRYILQRTTRFNTLRLGQDGRHFANDIFKCIFTYEKCGILIKGSFKYVCNGPIDDNPALAKIKALVLTRGQAIFWTIDG